MWQIRGSSGTESCTLSPFISYLLFADISVTGKELRKWDFCSDCSRILLGKHPVCSVYMQHGGFRMFSEEMGQIPGKYPFPHSMAAAWVQLAENTECQVTPACVLSSFPTSPHLSLFSFCVNSLRQNRSSPPRLMHHPQFPFYYHGYPEQSKQTPAGCSLYCCQ